MSLLASIRKISGQKINCLAGNHIFAEESFEFRLRYLSAIALGVAIDRAPKKSEIQAFLGLASNLSVEKTDADEQFSERNSLTEDDIILLFEALDERNANLQYMIDLTWIHAVDGLIDENEHSAIEYISYLLKINTDITQELHKFMVSLKNANYMDLYSSIRNLFGEKSIINNIKPILEKFIPYQDFIYGRWIDHGNNEITDCATGITWARAYIGDRFENGKFHGSPKRIIRCYGENIYKHANEIEGAIEQFSLSSPPIRDWRVPTKNEFSKIAELGYFSELFNADGLKKNTITNDDGSYDSLMGLSYGENFHILLIRENISWLQNNINLPEDLEEPEGEILYESEVSFQQLEEAIRNNTLRGELNLLINAWAFEDLHQSIKLIVNTLFPFRGILENRWIEHNDDTATDANTGITWFRRDAIYMNVPLKHEPITIQGSYWWNPFSWGKEDEEKIALCFDCMKLLSDLGLNLDAWHVPYGTDFRSSIPFPCELFDFDYATIESYPYLCNNRNHKSTPAFAEDCEKKAIILCAKFEQVEF